MHLAIKLWFEKPDRMAKFPVPLSCHETVASLGGWICRCIRSTRLTTVIRTTKDRRCLTYVHSGGVHAEAAVNRIHWVLAVTVLTSSTRGKLGFADILVDSAYFFDKIG